MSTAVLSGILGENGFNITEEMINIDKDSLIGSGQLSSRASEYGNKDTTLATSSAYNRIIEPESLVGNTQI